MLERWAQTVDIMVRSLTGDADGLLECPGLPQEETLMTMGVSWDLPLYRIINKLHVLMRSFPQLKHRFLMVEPTVERQPVFDSTRAGTIRTSSHPSTQSCYPRRPSS
jgi:hypothetical protein